jgi:hypothetical protein
MATEQTKIPKPNIQYGEGEPTAEQSGDFYVDLLTDSMYHKPKGAWELKNLLVKNRTYI